MPFRASSSIGYACRPVWVGVARRWTLGEWEGGLRDRRGTWRSSGISLSALSSLISHVIRWSDKLTMGRKPQNFNDVNSKFEGIVRELRAKLKWGSGAPKGFRVSPELLRSRVSGRRTLRDVRHAIRMITSLIHIHVRST